MRLHGRAGETRALAQLVEAAAGGSSCVLVVRGEAGIGKTTLLDRAADTAGRAGMEVLAVAGVEAERELGYAALHRLLARVAEDRTALPAPQRDALGVAWGLVEGRPADPFRVALAVLTLLTRRAARRPVLCVCDDAQWVDRESLRVLAFVARRIDADPVVVLFGLRDPGEGADDVTDHTDHTVLADLPALQVDGLPVEAVRTLAAEAAHGRFDERELDRLLVETGGNPLAVRELVAGWARDGGRPGASAWSASVAARPSLPARLEDRFGEQVRALPGAGRPLLLVVAAEPTGDADLVWRTLGHLGATGGAAGLADAARPAVAAGLLVLAPVVGFRHPLQRSAVHRGADPAQRRRVHAALAASIPAGTDTDRRTWHRAEATTGPDEQIAAELEESAARARDRAGYSTEAAFLAAAAERTAEPAACGRRLFAAAVAAIRAGLPGTAHRLLETVPRAAGEELLLVTALARGAALVQLDRCAEGAPLMADAAHGLAAVLPPPQAREALLEVVQNVLLTPHVELGPVRRMLDGAAGAVAAPPAEPAFADVALDGYRRHLLDGGPDGTAGLRRVVHALRGGLTHEVAIRWAPVCVAAPRELFDDAAMDDVTERLLTLARANATATGLRVALVGRAITATLLGSLDEAELLHAEAAQVAALGGSPFLQRAHDALLRAWRGDAAGVEHAAAQVPPPPEGALAGAQVQLVRTARAVLAVGVGRYDDGVRAGTLVLDEDPPLWGHLVLPDLVEAGVRGGGRDAAEAASARFAVRAAATGTSWARGLHCRNRALLARGAAAEPLHREAIEHLDRTVLRTERARARLLYGEWLRRRRRRTEARAELARAHRGFLAMGAAAFAERARTELAAAGASVRRAAGPPRTLTPHESRIARLAASGATNQEIATQLFVSTSTVEYHLRKVFQKTGVRSRRDLPAGTADGGT